MTPAESLNAQLTVPVGKTWDNHYLGGRLTLQVFKEAERGEKQRDSDFNERAEQVRDASIEAGSPLFMRRILASLELDVLESKTVTKEMFRTILANFVSPFSHRRELFVCFLRSFTWLESFRWGHEVVEIPADMRDELFAAAALLSMAVAHVSLPVDSEVSASGAAEGSCGSCSARAPGKISRVLFRVGAERGGRVRLDWNEIDQALLPTRMRRPGDDLNEAFASFDWTVRRGG
ncbi:unnamed protein product, partial [Prorocentrum cordatum]